MADIYLWLDEALKLHSHSLTFMQLYQCLTDCIIHLSKKDEGENISKDVVDNIVADVVSHHSACTLSQITSSLWEEKEKYTYSDVGGEDPFHHPFHLKVARRRDVLYKAYYGYIPCQDQLPSFVQIARAHAMKRPPPNLEEDFLWEALGATIPTQGPSKGKNIVVNAMIPGRDNIREFHVLNASALEGLVSRHDLGIGEVFSDELWCTAITFDIDGGTVDAREDGWSYAYPVDEIKHEILTTTRTVMLEMTHRRWDMTSEPPAIHVWVPEDPSEKKLSMRISIHMPPNVCLENVEVVSHAVKQICERLMKTSRYLIVDRVMVDDLSFERSANSKGWRAWDERERAIIPLETYLKTRQRVTVHVKKGNAFQLLRDGNNFVMEEAGVKVPIPNMQQWTERYLCKFSSRECLIDEGIYRNNRSLRLPHQSKFVNGRPVRRFVPFLKGDSKVTDALVHYPHNDTSPIPGEPLLVTLHRDTPATDVLVQGNHPNLEEVVDTIGRKFGMNVTKTTRKNGNVYLDVERKDGGGSGKGNFCLIKNDWHTNARMYFVLTVSGTLKMKCWSTKCQQILKN